MGKYTFTCLDFSSLACAFICWTSIESGLRLLINRSWLPIHRSRILTNNTLAALSLLCSSNLKAIKPFNQPPTSDCFFTSLFMRTFCEKNMKFGDVLSTGLITNFLSSKLMWRISDHVNVVFGANLFSLSYTFSPKAVTPSQRSVSFLFYNAEAKALQCWIPTKLSFRIKRVKKKKDDKRRYSPHWCRLDTYTNRKIVYAVHIEILSDFKVFHFRLVPRHTAMIGVPYFYSILPHLWSHLILIDHSLRKQILTGEHSRTIWNFVIITILITIE